MAARDHDGTVVPRTVTNCANCFAWGLTYAQGICLPCYNFAAPHKGYPTGECAACARVQLLKQGYCRLCWCQARDERARLASDARSAVLLAPYLAGIRWQQLFLSLSDRRQPPPRTAPRRYGAKGRPLKQPPPHAGRPRSAWLQEPLLPPGPRNYRAAVDLRAGPPPDNPWLAWALHLAHTTAEARGWEPTARRAMQRVLVMLLAEHREPDRIRVSDFADVAARQYINLDYVIEVLTAMDIIDDNRPASLEGWLAARLAGLPGPWRRDLGSWARTLRDGSPRSRPRHAGTVRAYVAAALGAAASWPQRDHLREVTREDVQTYLATLHGRRREVATTALRGLFRWAKTHKLVFRNPTHGLRGPKVPDPIWPLLEPDDISASVTAATTAQARLCVVLAAVHAARPGQIRDLHLDDVDLADRRITIAGNPRPLDNLTAQTLLDWLTYRRERWPNTANPHLLVSSASAMGLAPVSATWILNLRGLPGTLERLRIDRQLEEAVATGADPLHLAAVFGFSEGTAIRWAANARELIGGPHPDRLPELP
ncbi:integrase [Micromonospora sp. 4G57]|uniref:Integrase n=1 Tax=Micromonospora sicca TaxID=2202420 RepID=A0ABU5JQ36_9ACTN|nr:MULTISPECIES: integrase [unclassified Micromonospora]MDZ5447925.1 integrase [Micromonospora sp. 4G57]MDZ5494671.1 integrase [Micromonospora sp. 4G53]